MAKESMKAREVKRAKLVAKYAAKRAQLKAEGNYASVRGTFPAEIRFHSTSFAVELSSGRSLHYSVSPGNGSLAKKAMPQAPGPAWVPITVPMACTIGFCRCRFCVT